MKNESAIKSNHPLRRWPAIYDLFFEKSVLIIFPKSDNSRENNLHGDVRTIPRNKTKKKMSRNNSINYTKALLW